MGRAVVHSTGDPKDTVCFKCDEIGHYKSNCKHLSHKHAERKECTERKPEVVHHHGKTVTFKDSVWKSCPESVKDPDQRLPQFDHLIQEIAMRGYH